MILAELPQVVQDVGAGAAVVVAVLGAVAAVFKIPAVRRQWRLRVTEPNRERRREDNAAAIAPLIEPIHQQIGALSQRLDNHMASEEGQREKDMADRAHQREQLAEQLGGIEARLEAGHRWMERADGRFDELTNDIKTVHSRVLTSPATPRRFD